jgi:hypothetical protein
MIAIRKINTPHGIFIADFSTDRKTGVKKHLYTLAGRALPGNTTAIKKIAKGDRLTQWVANRTLEAVKSGDRRAKTAWRRTRDARGGSGRSIHALCTSWVKTGRFPRNVPKTHQLSFCLFVKWALEEKVQFLYSDRAIYSYKDWYAGTLDFVIIWRDKIWIMDIKTASEIYEENFYQTAGYENCVKEIGLPGIKELRFDPTKIAGGMIVNLPVRGGIRVQTNTNYDFNLRKFHAALELIR